MWGEDFFVTWGAVTSLDMKTLRAGDPLPSSGAPGIFIFLALYGWRGIDRGTTACHWRSLVVRYSCSLLER